MLTLNLIAGCGSSADAPARAVAGSGAAADTASTPPAEAATGAGPAFAPSADQFGLERFTIVTETRRAPVKVGLRTRRASTETLTRHIENYGERVALETRSDTRHERYLWNGERGILRDVSNGRSTDQGSVRLKRSKPDPLAVAPVAQLQSWGYEHAGERTVLGRQCEVWTLPGQHTEFCRWRHLVLEAKEFDAEGNETGSTTTVAIREGEGIPAGFESLDSGS